MPSANSEIENPQTLTRVSIEELRLEGTDDDSHEAVYGMPGSLLRLIGRTTHLIEEIEASGFGDTTFTPLPPDLDQKAMIVERSICTWGADTDISENNGYLPSTETVDSGSYVSDKRPELLQTMSKALSTATHHALLIYYFRSVHNTNPVILQHYVESVISNLEVHARCKKTFAPARVNVIVWPSFIAACEAIGEDLRSRSIECIRHALWSGFRNHEVAERVTREV
jgi:arginine metabolism regulation protein II